MHAVKAAVATILFMTGSAVSCAAADMPVADMPVSEPLPAPRAWAAPIPGPRLLCNGFGRCFPVGPNARIVAPRVFYPAAPAYALGRYADDPDYEVRRSYRERRVEAPEYEYRRSEEYRRSFERPYDAFADRERRADQFRRPDDYARRDDFGPRDGDRRREGWSREDRPYAGHGEPD